MKITKTALPGVLLLEPLIFEDTRGWFMESWTKKHLPEFNFVQDNHSYTRDKGTIRGIHFQLEPWAQTKLVRCTQGVVLDVAVDLRKNSPTFKQWVAVGLSSANKRQLLIPKGFGHGFLTLTNDVEFQYKTDNFYSPAHDRAIRYNDPELNISWGAIDVTVSEKDGNAPFLKGVTL